MKKNITIAVAILLTISLFTGCVQNDSQANDAYDTKQEQQTDENYSSTPSNKLDTDYSEKDSDIVSFDISAEEAKKIASEYLILKEKYFYEDELSFIYTYQYDEKFRISQSQFDNKSGYSFTNYTLYEYDVAFDWLKQTSIVDSLEATYTDNWTEYSYNNSGYAFATAYMDGRINHKQTINEKGQVIEENIYDRKGNISYHISYTYNEQGDLISETTDCIDNPEWSSKSNSTYKYNALGLKEKSTNDSGGYTLYEYNNNYCLEKVKNYSEDGELVSYTEYEYISKDEISAGFEQQEKETQDRKASLIEMIKNGADDSVYKELFSLTRTLDADDMDRFGGEWYREDGSSIEVSWLGDIRLICYDKDSSATIDSVLQYVSENIAMWGHKFSSGIGYAMLVYGEDSVSMYSNLAVNGKAPIAGTYTEAVADPPTQGTIDYSKCEIKTSAVMKQFEGVEDTWGCFRIYDITSNNEVFFEVDWYRATGFGGVAKLNNGVATFEIQYSDTWLKGSFTISDDDIVLNLDESTLMVGPGVYEYKYDTEVYRETTLSGYGTIDHSFFITYLQESNASSDITWEFLGSPYEIFLVTGSEYPGSFDLYKVIAANGAETYYASIPQDYLSEYGIYEIGLSGELQFVWKT